MIVPLVVAIALLYQCTALLAALRHALRREPPPSRFPKISLLKPLHGLDPGFREAARSHALQQYPDFEILFGVRHAGDPAAAEVERLRLEFPDRPIRLIECPARAPNGKVGVLIALAREARGEVLLINDSDVTVPPDYLRRVVAPLENAAVGVVTCLYRGTAATLPGRWEALGIATDFVPSVLVAPLAGVKDSGLGATLAFRDEDLRRSGGLEPVAEYLADDNVLARRIARLGLRTHLSSLVVTTGLQAANWGDVWRHQVRWHRTVRVTNLPGYLGLPVTFATLWSLAAAMAGWPGLALALLSARMAMAIAAGVAAVRCPVTVRYWPLVPLRDLWGVAVWLAGLFGDTVVWRGHRLRLGSGGRIISG